MARTYAPSRVSEIVQLWKSDLSKINKKAAEALADPAEFANLFPNFDEALALEEEVRKQRMSSKRPSASAYGGEKELAKHVEESATIADEVEEAPPTPPRAIQVPEIPVFTAEFDAGAATTDISPPSNATTAVCAMRFSRDVFVDIDFLSLVVDETFPPTAGKD